MNKQIISRILINCFFCLIFAVPSFANEECDKTKCPGPLAYYESLKCTPIYKKPGDCCAVKYDCSHLWQRSKKKCYAGENVYEIGEKLKKEDALPCDINCSCREGYDGIATFTCAIVDCPHRPPKPGCYLKRSPLKCCAGEEVCPATPADRPICLVDGKEYKDGEYFTAKDKPNANCICQEGYKGENVEPFCYTPRVGYCRPDMRHSSDIHNKCAPVYYSDQSPQTSCSVFSRCQNDNDTLISNSQNPKGPVSTDVTNTCVFGNIVMQPGDELNQATDYSSVCVKCVCEVPPIPTCQRLPDEECDVTKHPPFHTYD